MTIEEVTTFNVHVEAEGLQGRSKLEKTMQEWFEGRGREPFLCCGGTGKSTLGLKFAVEQVEQEGAACSSVRLVFALSAGSMAQDYAGLLGELCIRAGRVASAEAVLAHLTDALTVHTTATDVYWYTNHVSSSASIHWQF